MGWSDLSPLASGSECLTQLDQRVLDLGSGRAPRTRTAHRGSIRPMLRRVLLLTLVAGALALLASLFREEFLDVSFAR